MPSKICEANKIGNQENISVVWTQGLKIKMQWKVLAAITSIDNWTTYFIEENRRGFPPKQSQQIGKYLRNMLWEEVPAEDILPVRDMISNFCNLSKFYILTNVYKVIINHPSLSCVSLYQWNELQTCGYNQQHHMTANNTTKSEKYYELRIWTKCWNISKFRELATGAN